MTEEIMQHLLYRRYFQNNDTFCNVFIDYRSELDFLSISKSGYPTFFEIKLSKSDFRNDFKKSRHKMLLGEIEYAYGIKPKHFYYVTNGFEDDIPKYAGHIRVDDKGYMSFPKNAPELYKEKVTDNQLMFLYKKYYYRFRDVDYKNKAQAYDKYMNIKTAKSMGEFLNNIVEQ